MTWTLRAPIPGMGDNAVRELGSAVIGSKLYVAGGFDIDGNISDLFWEWDRPTNTWTAKANLPAARYEHGCAAIATRLYIAGGYAADFTTVLGTLRQWNQATNTWSNKTAMGTARAALQLVAVGTDLYAIGGSDSGGTVVATVEKYDEGLNSWSTKASMPAARWLHAAAVIGTDIYVVGGLDSGSTPVDDLYVYDTIGNTWSTLTSAPAALFALGAAAINGKLYVVGGVGATALYEYDPGTDTWTDLADPLPVVRAYAGVEAIGTYLYVAAGDEGGHKDTLYQWGTATATGGPTDGGKVWAIRSSSDADEWWAGDGTSTSGTASTFPLDRFTYAGGSDGGQHIYYLSIDDDAGGQWWVDVYDATRTTLLDRWEITGWTSAAAATPYYSAFSDVQHLTANATYVAVFAEAESAGNGTGVDSIDVTVFATDGTLLDQWTITSPDRLSGFTGSCIDAAGNLYFGRVDDATSDEKITVVDLTSGTATDLFTINDVDTAIIAVDGSWSGLSATFGLVEIDGDLLINGSAGLVRVQQDGTPVWWQPLIDPFSFGYYALAHSGRGSVWAANSGLYTADEYQYDGTYVQTITIPEPAIQAWFVAAARGGWSVDVLYF